MILKVTATSTVTTITVLGKPYAVISTAKANTSEEVEKLMHNAGYDNFLTEILISKTCEAKGIPV